MKSGKFYQSHVVSKDRMIDSLLDPIVSKIKNQSITSYFQLRQHDQPQTYANIFNPRGQKRQILPDLKQKMNRTIDTGLIKRKPEPSTLFHNERLRSLQNKRKLQKKPSIAECSKIKRHLVEEIDFQEIERIFSKKKASLNRYEYFCSKLQNKQQQNQKKIQYMNKTHGKFKRTQQQFNPEEFSPQKTFRLTQRKKFWVKGKTNNHKETKKSNNSQQEFFIKNL